MGQAGVEPTTRTVRDFKDFVEQEAGDQFQSLSMDNWNFWTKLNRIGARNIESQPPETVPDIDATVILSDEEWSALETEFRSLQE